MAERTVLVTGGAGYVGSVLVPRLLARGWLVRVLDLFLFGEHVLDAVADHPGLERVRGDLRDVDTVAKAVADCSDLVHLACVSNDPCFELDPGLGRSINLDAFEPLVERAKDAGVERFVYASSSSVYGVKSEPEVTEAASLEPLTDYSRFKAMCEEILERHREPGFTTVTVRPATICGYSPRQRLDVVVNILTHHAVRDGRIRVFGGNQMRPNIHIGDMCDLYEQLLELPAERIDGRVYNAGGPNHTVSELARIVADTVSRRDVTLETVPSDDPRSYHISSVRLEQDLGFRARRSVADAVGELEAALGDGRLPNTDSDARYYNVKLFQALAAL